VPASSGGEGVGPQPVAVLDIGSNSVRLVVFDGAGRAPIPIFNERVFAGLGRGLSATGRLSPEGMEHALDNVARFAAIARAMGVGRLDAVATAAVRDASDGGLFVAEVERRTGLRIAVLSGEDEARLSALGVLSDAPEADGAMGDLGGASLELVSLKDGAPGRHATLPLGPLRLLDVARADVDKSAGVVDRELGKVTWLGELAGRSFYAVGGAWRGLARVHMTQTGSPLRVIDHYSVKRARLEPMLALIAKMSRRSLDRLPDLPRRRVETLPAAAVILAAVLKHGRPKRVIFSACGLREGIVYSQLPAEVRAGDPLVAACTAHARRMGRPTRLGATLSIER